MTNSRSRMLFRYLLVHYSVIDYSDLFILGLCGLYYVSPAKTAEPIEIPFWGRLAAWVQRTLMGYINVCHLGNTIKLSVIGGDAGCCCH